MRGALVAPSAASGATATTTVAALPHLGGYDNGSLVGYRSLSRGVRRVRMAGRAMSDGIAVIRTRVAPGQKPQTLYIRLGRRRNVDAFVAALGGGWG